jgi:prefoldin subunit 2
VILPTIVCANILETELQLQYTNYKNGLQQIAQKIGDVESEAEEHKFVPSLFPSCNLRVVPLRLCQWHSSKIPSTDLEFSTSPLARLLTASVHRLVLETLEPLPADRKCFRMINGVLVERTVKDVVPALKTNSEGLRKVLEDLVKQFNAKQVEMEKWKARHLVPDRRFKSADESFQTEEEQYTSCTTIVTNITGFGWS